MPSPSNPLSDPRRDGRNRTTILVAGIVIVLAMTYGSGMSAEMHKTKAINEKLKVANVDLRTTQLDLRAGQALAQQLEARRQLDLAMQELDKRNFGTAQDHLSEAAARLDTVEQSNLYAKAHPVQTGATDQVYQPPVSTLDFSALAAQIKGTSLAAAADIGDQRQKVLGFAAQMDAQLAKVVPKPDAAFAPVTVKPLTMNDVPETPGNDVTRVQ